MSLQRQIEVPETVAGERIRTALHHNGPRTVPVHDGLHDLRACGTQRGVVVVVVVVDVVDVVDDVVVDGV